MRHIESWFGLTSVDEGREIVVLECPWDGSVSGRVGAAEGPEAIRRWGSTQEAVDETARPVRGVRVIDGGIAAGGHDTIEERARELLERHPGALLVGVGGDHSVTQPLLRAALQRHPDLGLLWLDAHADLFPAYDGDPASHACSVARAWDAGVDPGRTALVGLRSYAAAELDGLGRSGLVVSAREWLADGADVVAARIADRLAGRPVYLSLDIDVLDPAYAPGTGYPMPGGPSSRELLDLLAALWPRLEIVALDLVEVAPRLDSAGVTSACAAHLLLQLFAHAAREGVPTS